MSVLRRWAEAALGVPLTTERRDALYTRLTAGLDEHAALPRVLDAVVHGTEKAGALLAAQGMFLVVAIFAVDHGWPRDLCVPANLLLIGAALIVTTNLRSTSPTHDPDDPRPISHQAFDVLYSRNIRFNIALYFTFLSITLLAAAAVYTAL
jgi:hypothetical protein